jgi:hypothetical protein
MFGMAAHDVHAFLEVALAATPEAERPGPPFHRGVPAKPQLGAFGCAGIALFLADAARSAATTRERKRFDAWVASAADVYGRHARGEVREVKRGRDPVPCSLTRAEYDALYESLVATGKYVEWARTDLSPALFVANTAALAAFDLEIGGGGPYGFSAIRNAVRRAAEIAGSRSFLEALDARLLREELRAMLAARRDPRAARVESCLWRAAEEGKATHLLGRLDGGEHVVVFKVGRTWRIFAGPRDDVLATVPDAHMASATAAVLG